MKVFSLFAITDETHIQDLLQANNTLGNLIEVLGNNFLKGVLESWKQLYVLAIESLRSKHDIGSVPDTTTSEPSGKVKACMLHLMVPSLSTQDQGNYEISSEERSTRLMEIEAEIAKACQEEDYDRAGTYVCALMYHHPSLASIWCLFVF